jgi:hypothetical protein
VVENHRCKYPDCPLRDTEDDIAGKSFVESLEERLVKLENTHQTDVHIIDKKLEDIDRKYDAKFMWIIGVGVVQLAGFAIMIISNHRPS